MAFRDIKPAAQHHIQLIPKHHIGELDNVAPTVFSYEPLVSHLASVRDLTINDVDLGKPYSRCM